MDLDTFKKIIDKWEQAVSNGMPVIDIPAEDEALVRFVRELCGELQVCSGLCEQLSAILGESFDG